MNVATALRREDEIFRDFPIRFSPLGQASAAEAPTYVEQVPRAEPASQSFKIPLLYLGVDGRKFVPNKPIGVHITQDQSWFFAENTALSVVGMGETPNEAVIDLQRHIVHFWQHYLSVHDEQVTGDAIRLKQLFSNLLVELPA